jgi:peptidoglycan L-alanyl-D-glutamate endopeptidase CwlK
MKLSEEQQKFSRDLCIFLTYVFSQGYEVTFGEVLRTEAQQKLYMAGGQSKTMDSMHLIKCAADLSFFKDGKLVATPRPLGKYWESLDEVNRWGGSWRGKIESGASTFVDGPHFERKVG